jgi:hypothetical protein
MENGTAVRKKAGLVNAAESAGAAFARLNRIAN